ncbi:DUF305 domain-containing protein [Candidatus Kaiserbacteria bacterium]|nr:DUF305 domain-containing protein [Candidatus Kaiserbacteria bacterium]
MNTNTFMWGLGGIVVGVVLTLVLTPLWSGTPGYRDSMMGPGGTMQGGGRMSGEIDSHFIEQMIPHHEDAITMAKLASTRAEHEEIKTLAANIIKAQSAEIDMMDQWYKSWFGNDEVPYVRSSMGIGMMMHGGMMGNDTDTARLENAQPFDKAFIEEMIPHHQMAVMMAQMLSRATERPEMEQLAADIIKAQTQEIDAMREWYRTWYAQ